MCAFHVQSLLLVSASLIGKENYKFLYVLYPDDVQKCLETENLNSASGMHVAHCC